MHPICKMMAVLKSHAAEAVAAAVVVALTVENETLSMDSFHIPHFLQSVHFLWFRCELLIHTSRTKGAVAATFVAPFPSGELFLLQ
jgi:hypothetical protein